MCMPKAPDIPAPPPPPPPPPTAPKLVDANVRKARDDAKRRAALASGRSGTVATGGQGLTSAASVAAPTLTGG